MNKAMGDSGVVGEVTPRVTHTFCSIMSNTFVKIELSDVDIICFPMGIFTINNVLLILSVSNLNIFNLVSTYVCQKNIEYKCF